MRTLPTTLFVSCTLGLCTSIIETSFFSWIYSFTSPLSLSRSFFIINTALHGVIDFVHRSLAHLNKFSPSLKVQIRGNYYESMPACQWKIVKNNLNFNLLNVIYAHHTNATEYFHIPCILCIRINIALLLKHGSHGYGRTNERIKLGGTRINNTSHVIINIS